ncbi:hypothetical protein SRRS_15070 [Sporomusa rhizae]|uniref:hypothetical protein n=1 Tax=Sporomusa rhizae TaxID=357999 RepID=UPI00352B7839
MLNLKALEYLISLRKKITTYSDILQFTNLTLFDLDLFSTISEIKIQLELLQTHDLVKISQQNDIMFINLTSQAFNELANLNTPYPEPALLQQLQDIYRFQTLGHNFVSIDIGNNETDFYFMILKPYWQLQLRGLGVLTQNDSSLSICLTNEGMKVAKKNDPLTAEGSALPTTLQFNNCDIGVATTTASNFTVSVGMNFTDIEKLIKQNLQNVTEKETLMDAINVLKNMIECQKPIEKGGLAAISPFLEKHSWLSSPIASILLQYALTLSK